MPERTESESRKLLRRLRDVLSVSGEGQDRLDRITHLIADSMGTEVCSIYLFRDPETLEAVYLATRSGRMEAMTFTGPLAHTIDWVMFFSDSNQRLSLGVASVAGVAVGAGLHALLTGQFRWEGFRTTEDLANHLIGATLLGVGGVTALGCTIGQGLSGVTNLSLASFTAVAGIAAGAVAALKYQMWRLERAA